MANIKSDWEFPAVQWLGLSAFTAMTQVQSLVRERRFCKLCSAATKKKRKEKACVVEVYTDGAFSVELHGWKCLTE